MAKPEIDTICTLVVGAVALVIVAASLASKLSGLSKAKAQRRIKPGIKTGCFYGARPQAVIIPGHDGTKPQYLPTLQSVLSAHCDVSIIDYPPDRAMRKAKLTADEYRQRLPG